MKLIVAYVQPFMADRVSDALRAAKVHGVTILPCQGFGHTTEDTAPHYVDKTAVLGVAAKVKFEIVCRNDDTEAVVSTIRTHAHTGRHGDGKIFISEIGEAVDIRTGEKGETVL